MAKVSSGSFTTSSAEGRSLTFNWSVDSTSITGNYKKLYWSLIGSGSFTGFVMAGNFKVVIDNEIVYEKNQDYRIELYQGTVVASGYKTIYHNDAGEKTFSASVEAGIYTYARNCSGSGTWELPTIDRYANITSLSVTSKTETSITLSYKTDKPAWLFARVNDGDWLNGGEPFVSNTTSGTFTISYKDRNSTQPLDPATYYKINVLCRAVGRDSLLDTNKDIAETTYNYPYCTDSPNFTIGNSLTLTLYNPLGRKVNIYGYALSNGGEIFNGVTSGTSISGFHDESSVNHQYSSIPNATSGKYKVVIVYGNAYMTRDAGNTYSINTSNCTPTFNNFTYKDTNSKVTAVTGNDQILVKGLSNLQVTISSGNKMVAKNGASANKYIATIDTLNKDANYSTSDINMSLGAVKNSGTKRLSVTAYDSRNLSKAVHKDITVYDYDRPVINVAINRLNNFEAESTLKINGTYSRLNIGGTDKNTIQYVEYRYRETNGTWTSWTPLSTTISNGKFTCSDVILSLDNTKSFDFEVQVFDNLNSYQASGTLGVGQAIFFISTNKKACYINGHKVLAPEVKQIVIPSGGTGTIPIFLAQTCLLNFRVTGANLEIARLYYAFRTNQFFASSGVISERSYNNTAGSVPSTIENSTDGLNVVFKNNHNATVTVIYTKIDLC